MSRSEEIHATSPTSDDGLEDIEVFESKLIDDEMKSLKFWRSLMSKEVLSHYLQKKILIEDQVRLLRKEVVSKPKPDEAIVFKDYFIAGLRFPIDDLL